MYSLKLWAKARINLLTFIRLLKQTVIDPAELETRNYKLET